MGSIVGAVHTDAVLTNMAVRYANEAYVADQIMPIVQVAKDSDKYYVYDKSNFRTSEDDLWEDGSEAREIQLKLSSDSYNTKRRALAAFISDKEVQNADVPITPFQDSLFNVMERLKLKEEKRVAALVRSTSASVNSGTVTLAGVDQWSDFANSDPVDDIETAISAVRGRIARRPNTLVLAWATYEKLKQHPDIVERIKYTQIGVVTPQLLAAVFDLPRVIVCGAIENTAVENAADVLADVWGKDAWVGYVNPSPAIKQVSWGYQFRSQNLLTVRWREEPKSGERIRVSHSTDEKIVAADCGYSIIDAVA